MNKLFGPVLLGALLMSGCGTGQGTPSTAPSVPSAGPATASTTTAAAGAPKSARGNLIKTVGQPASITYKDETMANFVVKAIDVDAKCSSQYASAPRNGHIVVLTVDAETTPELAHAPITTWSLNMFGWKAIAENGTTVNGSVWSLGCLDSKEQLPSTMGPGEKATGKIAFDVPSASGTLIYVDPSATSGWEWVYPAK